MNRLNIIIFLFLLIIFGCINLLGKNTHDIYCLSDVNNLEIKSLTNNLMPVDTFKITRIVKYIGEIKVVICQKKSLIDSPDIQYCKGSIEIYKNETSIDSVFFNPIEPVGGNYGLLVYNKIIQDHLIISKFGDEGRTIIINNNGKVFTTIGGYVYYDQDSGLLFSIYDSDLFGFSVFDLNSDQIIMEKYDIEEEPLEFYKTIENKYVFLSYNNETAKENTWEIILNTKTIKKVAISRELIKNRKINELVEYQKLELYCE